jgi:hypothetical protein
MRKATPLISISLRGAAYCLPDIFKSKGLHTSSLKTFLSQTIGRNEEHPHLQRIPVVHE